MAESMPESAAVPAAPKKDLRKNVFITSGAHLKLTQAAKKLDVSNVEYASAAIDYFASNGLDPTAQETKGLVSVQSKVGEAGLKGRQYTAEIGNRIVSILRTFERELYKMLHAQQVGTFAYLERIEDTIMSHQVQVESQVLAPILEQLVKVGVESHISRVLMEILVLRTEDKKFSPEELKQSRASYDTQRDARVVVELRKLLDKTAVAQPKPATRPVVAAIPVAPITRPAQPGGAVPPVPSA